MKRTCPIRFLSASHLGMALLSLPIFAATDKFPLPRLVGLMAVNGKWSAALVDPPSRLQGWFNVGDGVGAFEIDAIDDSSVTLSDKTRARYMLRFAGETIEKSYARPPLDPEAKKRWINSMTNPMLEAPADPPAKVYQWSHLTDKERGEIQKWYRDHGWSLDVQTTNGGIKVDFSPLHTEERQAVVAHKRQRFFASLSEEQRVLFLSSQYLDTNYAPVRLNSAEEGAEKQEPFRGFLESALTPVQRKVFDKLGDFTEPLPPGFGSSTPTG